MATMTETPDMTTVKPSHDYHAEAHVLSGHLQRPIDQVIERNAPATLRDRRGGHITRLIDDVSIEGLISFTKGQTRVSGSRSLKNNGWVTLSTSIIEGLNILEVVTADRIVSQVSTDHAYENGHIPHVTFLGSQFNNLQISGFPLTLTLNFGLCGDTPAKGKSYFQHEHFLNNLKIQAENVLKTPGLPAAAKTEYDKKLANINQLIENKDKTFDGIHDPITCSLVQSIEPIPIPDVQIFGNVLVIREFGTVTLGEIEVGERMYEGEKTPSPYFTIKGVTATMGCVAHGTAEAGTATANGAHKP